MESVSAGTETKSSTSEASNHKQHIKDVFIRKHNYLQHLAEK